MDSAFRCSATKVEASFSLSERWPETSSVAFHGKVLAGFQRKATVRCVWNSLALFTFFEVDSCRLHARVEAHDGDDLWLDDGVEILIDAGRHRTKEYLPEDFAYHINILNAVFDDRGTEAGVPDPAWHGKATHQVKILGETQYTIAIAIPWDEIGVQPVANETVLGVDFCVNGSHPDTWEYDYFDWCGLPLFHDPSGFGDLYLTGE